MLEIDKIKAKAVAADVYWEIQEEIEQKETAEYIWHDCRLDHNSKLPKYVGKKILSKKVLNEKWFKAKEILLAQNLFRACVGRQLTVITISLRRMLDISIFCYLKQQESPYINGHRLRLDLTSQ